MGDYCKEHNCPWYDIVSQVCKSPNDPYNGECDYNWATECPECHKLIAVGDDDDGYCPYCEARLSDD